MLTSITIRRLHRQDAAQFREVRLHGLIHDPVAFAGCHVEESRLTDADYADWIADESAMSAIFGAFLENSELVGIVGFSVSNALKMQHKGMLWGMYTMPIARGLGVGQGLMDALLAYARSLQGMERVLLAVTASNTSASRWYAKQGFQLYGVERRAVKLDNCYEDDELRSLDLYPERLGHEQLDAIRQLGIPPSLSDRLPGREL